MSKSKLKHTKKSIFNLNTIFANNTNKKHNKLIKSKYISKLSTISIDYLKKKYNAKNYNDIIISFYALNNPIITYLVEYNDNESKKLIRNGLNNLKLVEAYKIPDIEETLKAIDVTYKIHQDLLKELKLKDIPKIVKYASEDFTRGIRTFLDTRYKHLPINLSNGFVKLWEILHIFKLMDTPLNSQTMNVFHIAEAPGQMVLCAKYYCEKKCSNITNYDWRANSLNPYNYEVKKKYGALRDDYKLIKNNPQKWLWGADNTGDITKVNNIKWFKKYIDTKWLKNNGEKKDGKTSKIDLIIGDGGLGADTNSIYNLQKLDLAQVINVIACSSIGGSCVIKHFTSYMINKPKETIDATSFFISFIYLYYICFEEVNLFKPYTSDATSGEFYVIGKKFKGIEDTELETLYTILNKFKTNNSIFPKDAIPETFMKQIYSFLDLLTKYNIKGYEKQNLLLNCYKKEIKNKIKHKSKHKSMSNSISNNVNHNEINKNCNLFMTEKNIENILIPRYNQWIKINEFE